MSLLLLSPLSSVLTERAMSTTKTGFYKVTRLTLHLKTHVTEGNPGDVKVRIYEVSIGHKEVWIGNNPCWQN